MRLITPIQLFVVEVARLAATSATEAQASLQSETASSGRPTTAGRLGKPHNQAVTSSTIRLPSGVADTAFPKPRRPAFSPYMASLGFRFSDVGTTAFFGGATMLPFETPSIYEQLPRFVFKMPRVVPDQKAKFEADELFRRLSRESEVRYTGFRDRPLEERQMRFQSACREGHTEVAFVATGTNLQLVFGPCSNGYSEGCDFDKEQGKVHIKSSFIMNGVCVRWRGWLDLDRLDGVGCLEYDEDRGRVEDTVLREQIERYNQRLRDFEEKQRAFRAQQERHVEAEAELRKKASEMSPDRSTSASN